VFDMRKFRCGALKIRASPIRAHGSHLGYVTARRDIPTKFRMRASACDTLECGVLGRRRREAEIGCRFADTIKFHVRKPFAWRLRVRGQFREVPLLRLVLSGSIARSHPSIVVLCFRGQVVDDPVGRPIVRNRFCAKNEANSPDVADQRDPHSPRRHCDAADPCETSTRFVSGTNL